MSSREFNHDIGKAKRLKGSGVSMFDLLHDDEASDFDFDAPRIQEIGPRAVEFD